MKLFLVVAALLFASEAFASSVCLITVNGAVVDNSKWFSELYIECNAGNSDSQVIRKEGSGSITNLDVATAISSLLNKGYALTGQSEFIWTLTKN